MHTHVIAYNMLINMFIQLCVLDIYIYIYIYIYCALYYVMCQSAYVTYLKCIIVCCIDGPVGLVFLNKLKNLKCP